MILAVTTYFTICLSLSSDSKFMHNIKANDHKVTFMELKFGIQLSES